MHDKHSGLYAKYRVYKRGEEVLDNVFVLNLDTDPLAHKALRVYAEDADAAGYHHLASDLFDLLSNYAPNH